MPRTPLTTRQIDQLLQPINPKRVLKDGRGNAHLAQHDVTAHLTRIFGFCGWEKKIIHEELVFEQERVINGKPSGRWDVCYKVRLKLVVKSPSGEVVCATEDGSMGVAENQRRGEAHDLAYKSAISLSLKRAAKDLGDQFGLSLYNHGETKALVLQTLVRPGRSSEVGFGGTEQPAAQDSGEPGDDVQSEIPVVAAGHDGLAP